MRNSELAGPTGNWFRAGLEFDRSLIAEQIHTVRRIADEVTVLLPQEDSRLLTRELFYTAVTRAKERVRVVGSEPALRAAIERRAVRASGLAQRLRRS